MGQGSKYNPIKASIVVDSDEEEEEKVEFSAQPTIKATIEPEEEMDKKVFARNILNELDDIIDLDNPVDELNRYVMDEHNDL